MTRSEMLSYADYAMTGVYPYYPLYHCNAKVFRSAPNQFILKSYSTFVAFATVKAEKIEIYVFDFYSNTTNITHVSRFRRWLRERYGYKPTACDIIPLYRNSGMGKREYNKHCENDWADTIRLEYKDGKII